MLALYCCSPILESRKGGTSDRLLLHILDLIYYSPVQAALPEYHYTPFSLENVFFRGSAQRHVVLRVRSSLRQARLFKARLVRHSHLFQPSLLLHNVHR